MKKILSLFLTLFLFICPSIAKDKTVSFNAEAAWDYIKDLAADSMLGRESGQPGGVLAEDYIASKFRQWGLECAGNHETYFHNFTIEHSHVEEGVVLEIVTDHERRNFYYEEDWRVQRLSGSSRFTTELAFVGYGIHAPEKEHDDYIGVDVKGKLVLFSSGSPRKLEDKLKKEAQMYNRIKAAQDHGALGVAVFSQDREQRRYLRLRLKKEIHKPDFVILTIEDKITDFIFKDLEVDLRYLYGEIDKTSKPMSFEMGVKAFVSVDAIFDERRPTRNVLAKISGRDKRLKDEYVIIGAHMDHFGVNPLGEVMNGANDNASGTAVVMEIARIMKLNDAKLRRTVIFALWAGEEQGLLGSRHYADHNLYPLEKTVAYINLDMVGHGNGNVPFRGVYYAPEIWRVLEEKLPREILDYVKPGRGGPGGSDHSSFLAKGVPGFFIITEGHHFKYHQSRDDIDLIKPEILKRTGDFVHAAVKILASEPENLIQPMRRETIFLKYQNLINFKLSSLDKFIEHHKDARDSHVDLQLSLIEEKEGLSGDELRMDILKSLVASTDKIKNHKGLTYYSDSNKLFPDIRQGKTTILVGLKGVKSFSDAPQWTQVLVKQGIYFVVVDDPSPLFNEKELTEEGKKILEGINTIGLLLGIKGLNVAQAKSLLNASRKPVILFSENLPDTEIQKLIKRKKSVLGLTMGQDDEPSAYFKKLDEAKDSIGTDHIMIVNEQCLWGEAGKGQLLKVISEILNAQYERMDISNIFSGNFLRVLNEVRGEEEVRRFAYVPF